MSALLNRLLRSTFGVIALLAIFLLILEIQSPRFFLWDDNATQFCGYYQYNYQSILHQKTFPWMVWTQYAGQSNLAQSQSGVFYLPAYFATGFSRLLTGTPFWNIDFLIVLHLLAGAYGMICFLRAWKISPEIANTAGLLYATTPFFLIVSKSWIFVAYSMAYTPWLFLLVDRFLAQRKASDLGIYILLKSLFFFQGYSHVWINLSLMEGLYFLWRWNPLSQNKNSAFWKTFISYSGAQIIHLLVILPQLWINTQSVHESPHRGSKISMDQLLAFRLDPSDAFLSQLFYFQPQRYLLSSSAILFLGGSAILFYYLYRKIRTGEKWSPPHLTMAGFLFFTLILSTSAYALLSFIPPFHILRWPIKFMMIVPFFYAGTFAFFGKENQTYSHLFLPWILFASALLQMGVVLMPSHQSSFSKLRIESKQDLQVLWPYQSGRVLPVASDEKFVLSPHLLAYNYGTWTHIPTLAGYDQLISKTNYKIALDLQVPGVLEVERVRPQLSHLKNWGVRYLTGSPDDPQIQTLDHIVQFHRIYEDSTLIVWEYENALPLISPTKTPLKSIPFQMTPSSLLISNPPASGDLTLRFAPQKNLRYQLQTGDEKSSWLPLEINPDQTLKIEFPSNTRSIELAYRPSFFEKTTFFLSSILVILLIGIAFQFPRKLSI
ncbi:MAG: hypothetical protein V4507_16435 [Verrucomicrobiota bacterium]